MSDPKSENAAFRKARTGRNIAIFVGLLAFVILVFVITLTHLGANALATNTL
ncbi:MAG TPA: hypothetical protein VHW60_05315 [Caulobacteraceae bacterium]|jgi:hypothetical protein|nr:hypothetical protein [Caulobacteraceae bacterium]